MVLNGTVGAGILTIPYLFSQAGLVIGIFLVLAVGAVNAVTLHFLTIAHDVTGARSYIGTRNVEIARMA
jgi:sodium-coupled neutral amino acid transporter 11